jgi:hypothetical protein
MTDRITLAYALIALMLLIGAGILLRFTARRRRGKRTSSRINVSVQERA